jgi:hypothetical protein
MSGSEGVGTEGLDCGGGRSGGAIFEGGLYGGRNGGGGGFEGVMDSDSLTAAS